MAAFFGALAADFSENMPAQLIGFVALFFYILSFQFNSNRKIVAAQIFSSFLYMVHYFWLGALSGAIANIFSVLSNLVSFFRGKKKWADMRLWPFIFIALSTAFSLPGWEGFISLCPIVSFACSRMGLWSRNARVTRCFYLPASVLFLIYNIVSHSYSGILAETFGICSLLIAFVRFDLLKRPPTASAE